MEPFTYVYSLKKNLNVPRPSEHPPVRGENVEAFRWDHRLQIQNVFMAFKRVPRCIMVVTLGQQYNVGEKPTAILYTYINRHAGTPTKSKNKTETMLSTSLNIIVIIYCFISCQDKASTWYLNGFPDGGNLGSAV